MTDLRYPFAAIVGQEQVKKALLYNLIEPRIGGVLLCGEKGTAKSTIVRGLAALTEQKVVDLPLSITEDMLVGAIDFEKAVKEAMYRKGKAYDVFKNTVIKNCTIWNDWGKCLEIGAETRAEEITNIVFENCSIIHVTGSVLDCYNIDYADVHDVIYSNIDVEYDDIIMEASIQSNDDERYINNNPNYSPNLICVITDYHHEYSAGGVRRGKCHDIKFENIKLLGKYEPKCLFKGYDEEHKTKDIVIENIYWNGKLLEVIKKENFTLEEYTENIIYRKL